MIKMIEFGFTWYAWNTSHDSPGYLKGLPRYKRVKLCAINFKCVYGEGELSAIQLELTNADPTPWIKTDMSENDEVQRIDVDHKKDISKIAMLMLGGFHIHGLRLYDHKGRLFVEKVWCIHGSEDAEWVTKIVPFGVEIVGLQAYLGDDKFCRLGWLFVTPKINDKNMYRKPKKKKTVIKLTDWEYKQQFKEMLASRMTFCLSKQNSLDADIPIWFDHS